MEEENQTSIPTNDEKGFSAANQQQNKNTEQNQNQPSRRRMISNKGGQGRFFGLRKYFIDDELEGESAAAETLSAPGDLSKLPKAWRHNMDFLRQSRATTQQPGTSQQQSSAGNEDDDKKTTSSKTKATTPPTVQANMRRGQKDAAIPLLNGQSQQSTCRQQQQQQQPRKRGHLRGTRSNEFASGPPFPKKRNADHKRKGELPANTSSEEDEYDDDYPRPLNERQKQQQMALIEHELNVMADQTKCGISRWRPAWLQRFARKQWMLFLLCWFCAIQGMIVSGLFPSSISTIERRFQFSTSTMGRIMQFYEFGYVLFCIPVSYFGGRHSKSTVLGAGLFLMSLGSLVFTLPHFIAEPYTSSYQADASDLQSKCPDNGLTSQSAKESLFGLGARPEPLTACPSPENQPGTFRYVFLFCLAHFMHGVGATPLFTIGVSYIDENVGPALSSLYIGIFYTFAIFGPAIGFFASSKFLLWHSDFMVTGQKMQKLIIDLDETDPKWVGAWYIGFILAALLGLLAVFPILILPKLLPESLKWHRTRLQEEKLGTKKRTPECCGMPSSNRTAAVFSSRNGGLSEDDAAENGSNSRQHIVQFQSPTLKNQKAPIWYQLWLDVRHIPIAIYKILANGPYMLLTFAMSISGLILTGCSTFMSKYLERQFGVAPSKATLFMGAIMVPMAGFGTMFSGLIINRFRLSCARTLQYCIVLVLCSLLLSPMYFIYCDHDQLVGIERHYPVNDTPANHYDAATDSYMYRLEVQCNARCHCSSAEYHPVCAERIDGSQMAFYSPCYAGCPQAYSSSQKEYTNCSCAPDEIKGQQRKVKKGYCESKCRGLFAFMVFFAPFCFFVFAVAIAMIIVVLRTVDYDERSFALGIQWILVRVIGTIPAPVVFGWLFDFSCIRQHFDPCSGEHGSCMLYNNKSLADLFLAFTVAGQLVALVCLIGVLMFFAGSLHDDPLPATAADAPNEMECKTAVEFGISGSSSKRHSRRSQQREEEGKDCGEEEKTPLAEKEKRPSSPAESGANGSSCRDEHHLDTARDDA